MFKLSDPAHLSLWQKTSAEGPSSSFLKGNNKAEVVVIGAGIAGLTTALHLSEAGIDVAVIEAGEIACGATGKSGGLIAPDFIRHSPVDIENEFGPIEGEKLIKLVGSAAKHCFDLIKKHNISCEARQDGFWTPAHNDEIAQSLKMRAKQWKDRGFAVDYYSADQVCQQLGTTFYQGAIKFDEGGSVNPVALCRGLADIVIKLGGRIYTQSRVTKMSKIGSDRRVETKMGFIDGKKIVLAANGGNAQLHPDLQKTILPLKVIQYATKPYLKEARAEILKDGGAFTDKRPYLFTARFDVFGRMISALPDFFMPRSEKTLILEASKRVSDQFSKLKPIKIESMWRGTAWLNSTLLPKIYELDEDVYAIQACNGRGLANNMVIGKEMAESIIKNDKECLSIKPEKPRPIKGYLIAQTVPSFMMLRAYLKQKFF
ncbi:MAG: FAD-binding oxidoreductase [Kordiimonadaceae bacterium]|nr:FAD-binding oxidoreductase [Kordiimonadaceae bacterium]